MALLSKCKKEYYGIENHLKTNVSIILSFLQNEGFIQLDNEEKRLTPLGYIASKIREVHCLVMSRFIEDGTFDTLSTKQIISILSCFTNVSVSEEYRAFTPFTQDGQVKNILIQMSKKYDECKDFETTNQLNTGVDYEIQYDLIEWTKKWADASSVEECKLILQEVEKEKGVFLGEFVKAILKINHISSELEKIAENIGNIELLSKLKEIPILTLKFVATNQSLYV
jgi:superfamily II RNA helicase